MNERFLTLEQAAERLQVSTGSVRRWLKQGRLRGYKPGGVEGAAIRIDESDLDTFMADSEMPRKEE